MFLFCLLYQFFGIHIRLNKIANIQFFLCHRPFRHSFVGRFIKSQYKSMFQQVSKTRKAVHTTTMITTYGVTHNAYWNNIQSEVKMDDLFKENR